MRVVVTGGAGFIGSHLVESLARDGHEVLSIDCLTPYYARAEKLANLEAIRSGAVQASEADLRLARLEPLLEGAEVVFHQAAQPGVRASWGESFAEYTSHNVLATQRLLEAAKNVGVGRVVYGSSSSVYGSAASYPVHESTVPHPFSPYGVSKLAGEHLCAAYSANFELHTVVLRYFTVFGPRQRPDMAIRRLIDAALTDSPFPLLGDGGSSREFTYVSDVVNANRLAAQAHVPPATAINISGGGEVTVAGLIELVEEVLGRRVRVDRRPALAGDVRRNGGDTSLANRLLGWEPAVGLAEGLRRQAAWQRAEVVPSPVSASSVALPVPGPSR